MSRRAGVAEFDGTVNIFLPFFSHHAPETLQVFPGAPAVVSDIFPHYAMILSTLWNGNL